MKKSTVKALALSSLRIHGPTTREGIAERLKHYRYRVGLDAVRKAVRELVAENRLIVERRKRTTRKGVAEVLKLLLR